MGDVLEEPYYVGVGFRVDAGSCVWLIFLSAGVKIGAASGVGLLNPAKTVNSSKIIIETLLECPDILCKAPHRY